MKNENSESNFKEDKTAFKVDRGVKEEFLEKQIKSTRKFYLYILQKADEYEHELGKHIYDFNIEERDLSLIHI